jgi:DtxR family transcriptional regulator, Mn-dependent transcriptional regulator
VLRHRILRVQAGLRTEGSASLILEREGAVASHLIDSTEMYVRTVWELEEEGIPPIRARLSERLNLSAPSVSETVARLEDEGLLKLSGDRTLELTPEGRRLAVSVMRKHRLAERLLVDVIGIDWEHVHPEACRWEHVISDEVEQRLIELLDRPTHCPHGNPIPGLADEPRTDLLTLTDAAEAHGSVTVARLSEQIQGDTDLMAELAGRGVRPGAEVELRHDGGAVEVDAGEGTIRLDDATAQLIYVRPVA